MTTCWNLFVKICRIKIAFLKSGKLGPFFTKILYMRKFAQKKYWTHDILKK